MSDASALPSASYRRKVDVDSIGTTADFTGVDSTNAIADFSWFR